MDNLTVKHNKTDYRGISVPIERKMTYKRYIFLDIDGVLNHPAHYERMRVNHTPSELHAMSMGEYHIDPFATKLLNQLSPAEIIISSSWTYCDETVGALRNAGLELPITGGTQHIDLTERHLVRGNAIAKWFSDTFHEIPRDTYYDSFSGDGWWHPGRMYFTFGGETSHTEPGDPIAVSYAIIDDNADMLMDQSRHFVHVDHLKGLTQSDIDVAKTMLNL